MNEREELEKALNTAHRALAHLEKQAAGFGSLNIPAHLAIEIEDKQREVAALKSKVNSQKETTDKTLPTRTFRLEIIFYLAIAVVVVAVGFFVWQFLNKPQITLIFPTEGATVSQNQSIKGTASNIPKDQKIGLMVLTPLTGFYYYQQTVTDITVNNEWVASARFGNPDDAGKFAENFDLLVITMDQKAYNAITTAVASASAKGTTLPFDKLPDGVTIYARVNVVRR